MKNVKSRAFFLTSVWCCMLTGWLHAQTVVQVLNTSNNPFILSYGGNEIGDPFPVYWDGLWHLYTLSSDLKAIFHFTSSDLVEWKEHEPAMLGKGIATGTVVRHNSKFYMFYTDSEPQTIRLVISDSPWYFDFNKSLLVAKADDEVYSKGWFRDPYIFYYEEEKLWWMLPEARCEGTVSVGLFKSEDLVNWTQHDPIFSDASRQYGSCPQIFQEGEQWYLTCLDYGTWYYTATNPYGPWNLQGQYHSRYLTAASRIATDGDRRLCWGFFSKHPTPERDMRGYGGPLGVGREMVFDDGRLIGVRPLPELVADIRMPKNNVDLFAFAREHSGKWKIDVDSKTIQSVDEAGGVLIWDLPGSNSDYYFETEIQFDSPMTSGDLVVRTSKNFDCGYRVSIEPDKNKIAIRAFGPGAGTFVEKEHSMSMGKPVHLHLFVYGNQMEVFIDGRACLSARIAMRSDHLVAIELANGGATIIKPLLHYFQ